jgi:hypothetical protein
MMTSFSDCSTSAIDDIFKVEIRSTDEIEFATNEAIEEDEIRDCKELMTEMRQTHAAEINSSSQMIKSLSTSQFFRLSFFFSTFSKTSSSHHD